MIGRVSVKEFVNRKKTLGTEMWRGLTYCEGPMSWEVQPRRDSHLRETPTCGEQARRRRQCLR